MGCWPKNLSGNSYLDSVEKERNEPLKNTPDKSYDYDPYTGFYSQIYVNNITGIGVISIRGTDNSISGLEDAKYFTNISLPQYKRACDFWRYLKNGFIYSKIDLHYVCGHSLGGILAKLIAPVTGLKTVAFNSPGVKEFLTSQNPRLPSNVYPNQVVNFCASSDPIGMFRSDNDLGKYTKLDIKNYSEKIKPLSQEETRVKSLSYLSKAFIENQTDFHSMRKMYEYIRDQKQFNYKL